MNIKYFIVLILLPSCFLGCEKEVSQEEAESASRISALEEREHTLLQELEEKDKAFKTLVNAVSQVEKQFRNLYDTRIEMGKPVHAPSPEVLHRALEEDVQKIDYLIRDRQKSITHLRATLRKVENARDSLKVSMMEDIGLMERLVSVKEQHIENLTVELNEARVMMDHLSIRMEDQRAANQAQLNTLNTAYYIAGNFRELKNDEVLEKKGEFLGFLGGARVMKADFNHRPFEQINIMKKDTFMLTGKKIELVSIHPPGSYNIHKNGTAMNLIVSNPERFWESSKYLVMSVK